MVQSCDDIKVYLVTTVAQHWPIKMDLGSGHKKKFCIPNIFSKTRMTSENYLQWKKEGLEGFIEKRFLETKKVLRLSLDIRYPKHFGNSE